MRRAKIEVVHETKLLKEADVLRAIHALQRQIHEDFAPAWGIDADLHYAHRIEAADPAAWQLLLLDVKNGDDGYHELTKAGLPLGKVFVKVAIDGSGGWTSTASHELLELLADPDMSRTVFVETNAGPRVYEVEVCDPCQDDRDAYRIDGELVSDFVYPAWFSFFAEGDAQYDHARRIRSAYEVRDGGYASYYDVHDRAWRSRGPGKAGWLGVWGGPGAKGAKGAKGANAANATKAHEGAKAHDAAAQLAQPHGPRAGGSRRSRRALPRLAWRASER